MAPPEPTHATPNPPRGGPPWAGWLRRCWPRGNSLFTRLLLAQALSATLVVVVFGLAFYVERNRTIGRLVGERWGPALALAQAAAQAADSSSTPGSQAAELQARWRASLPTVQVVAEPPGPTVAGVLGGPRVRALRDSLAQQGLQVQAITFTASRDRPTLWLTLDPPGPHRRWLGVHDELVEPRLPLRLLLAVGLGGVLVVGLSAWLARRLSRPLEQLRQHLDAHPAGAPPSDAPTLPPLPHASAEVQAIAQAWQALQARNALHERERQLLLAGVSHDLRSPLARIRMAAELLPDASGVATRREVIVRNVDVADRLIGSFLDHVRASTLALDDTVDLHQVARQVLTARLLPGETLAPGQPHARLQLDSPGPCLRPRCNALLMERTLGNLLDNALQHGAPPVRLRLLPQANGALQLCVDDAGPGLGPGDPQRLLQAFARGDASRQQPGTGLGLAVVAEVMRRQGGRVDFEALQPQGCRVRLSWPAA